MILNDERLDALTKEGINNNIDKEDVIRFITTYSLQEKVSIRENDIISKFCKELMLLDME